MNASEIHPYQYLWDGSHPGWVLVRLTGSYINLSLRFSATGPSSRELIAMRRSVHGLKSMPLNQIIENLRGCSSYPLGRFELEEARTVAALCRNEGLYVVEESIDQPNFLPRNEITNSVLLIEDDELARRVCECALLHGVPVRELDL